MGCCLLHTRHQMNSHYYNCSRCCTAQCLKISGFRQILSGGERSANMQEGGQHGQRHCPAHSVERLGEAAA